MNWLVILKSFRKKESLLWRQEISFRAFPLLILLLLVEGAILEVTILLLQQVANMEALAARISVGLDINKESLMLHMIHLLKHKVFLRHPKLQAKKQRKQKKNKNLRSLLHIRKRRRRMNQILMKKKTHLKKRMIVLLMKKRSRKRSQPLKDQVWKRSLKPVEKLKEQIHPKLNSKMQDLA